MSRMRARQTPLGVSGYETSVVRCAVAVVLVVLGIAWLAVYVALVRDAAYYTVGSGPRPDNPIPAMAKLKDWNFLIGFGLFFLGLMVSAHKKTPMGRGRGVVVGMLGCFLVGLIWIVVFYFVGVDTKIPLMSDLGQKNLLVGVAFMAVGFSFATKWE